MSNPAHRPGSVLPTPAKMPRKRYERELTAPDRTGQGPVLDQDGRGAVLIIFEGRDTAGKGGTIKRFREHLNPRGAPHVALPSPNEVEQTQCYFQRYFAHLPDAGEFVFFDRSWYNRAGVERVMGYCDRHDYSLFLRQTPLVEAGLVEDGIRLFKLYLAINADIQIARLREREDDPLKTWKLSPIDRTAPDRFDDYTRAQNDMFFFTHTLEAPWAVINANDKRTARINAIRHVLSKLPYEDRDDDVVRAPEPDIVGAPGDRWPELDGVR